MPTRWIGKRYST